jgi:hypothetical protein
MESQTLRSRNASQPVDYEEDSGFLGLGPRILFGGFSEACLVVEGCLQIPP